MATKAVSFHGVASPAGARDGRPPSRSFHNAHPSRADKKIAAWPRKAHRRRDATTTPTATKAISFHGVASPVGARDGRPQSRSFHDAPSLADIALLRSMAQALAREATALDAARILGAGADGAAGGGRAPAGDGGRRPRSLASSLPANVNGNEEERDRPRSLATSLPTDPRAHRSRSGRGSGKGPSTQETTVGRLGRAALPDQSDAASSDTDSLIRIARLRPGDGAWVRRSTGAWTRATLRERGGGADARLVFVVDARGSTKTFPMAQWASCVRTVAEREEEGDDVARGDRRRSDATLKTGNGRRAQVSREGPVAPVHPLRVSWNARGA